MISAGIKELKARLSYYVEKVRQGEEILITDHGQEVALLSPISQERRAIKLLIDTGKAHWSGDKPKGISGISIEGKSLSETVIEERR